MINAQVEAVGLLGQMLATMQNGQVLSVSAPVKFTDFTEFTEVVTGKIERQKESPKLIKALNWLEKHPASIDDPLRVLADKIGVSHTWVAQARRIIQARKQG